MRRNFQGIVRSLGTETQKVREEQEGEEKEEERGEGRQSSCSILVQHEAQETHIATKTLSRSLSLRVQRTVNQRDLWLHGGSCPHVSQLGSNL